MWGVFASWLNVIGQNHRFINSGYHSKEFFKNMWETIVNGKVWHEEIKNKAKDGSYYWVDTVIVPIKDEQENFTHFLSLRTLISGRKQLQTENEQYVDSLETLNGQLEKYNYVISHDLKAPLQKIAALTDMLLEEIKEGNTLELKNISNFIHQSIASAQKIITETLEEAKKKNQVDDQINIKDLIEEVQQLIIIPPNFKLSIHCDFSFVPGKKIQLLQLLMNLITNAIKYNDKEQCLITFEGKEEENHFFMAIKDNGKGIPSNKLNSLFNLFQRDANQLTDSHGVGLSIVKSIIESRGGKISVSSIEGVYTEVGFTWPKVIITLDK